MKSALSTKRLELKSEINANTREKGIILKFKELISESIRDEIALNNLQQMKLNLNWKKIKLKILTLLQNQLYGSAQNPVKNFY